MSKYYYNKDYFQIIDSRDKAYWLGFLYADGSINRYYKNDKLKAMSVELQLCNEDRHHLEKFNQSIESNIEIHDKVSRYNDKEYRSSRLCICCTKMCYDLIDKGCIPNKTFDICMPSEDVVPDFLIRDFLRGFFDGDGCISVTQRNNKPHIEVNIVGIETMLQDITSYLIDKKIITVNPKIFRDKRSSASSVFFYGDTAKDFLDYIYDDCGDLCLDRKYDKYLDFYSNYQLGRHGVYWNERNNAYVVTICINGKRVRVGQNKDLHIAIEMRKSAEIEKMNIENMPA